MAIKFEELINGMVNVGFGAAAVTAEKGKEIFEDLTPVVKRCCATLTRAVSTFA